MFHHYCYFGTKIKETDDVKVHLYNHFDENEGQAFLVIGAGLHMHKGHK